MNIGDKVRFRLQPYGLGALAIITHDLGHGMVAVETVPERRLVAVSKVELSPGWGEEERER